MTLRVCHDTIHYKELQAIYVVCTGAHVRMYVYGIPHILLALYGSAVAEHCCACTVLLCLQQDHFTSMVSVRTFVRVVCVCARARVPPLWRVRLCVYSSTYAPPVDVSVAF